MKKVILLFLLSSSVIFSQVELSAGMGLNFFSAPDLIDYFNANYPSASEIPSFNTSADFFGEMDYNLNQDYQIGIEYTFNIYSYNSDLVGGIYDLSLNQHKPSITAYFVKSGEGYKFKFGGGLGLRIAQVSEKIPGLTKSNNYSANGFGILLKAQGDTKLGKNIYALIAGEVRYDMPGELTTLSSKINLNSFGVGLKLGISYYL